MNQHLTISPNIKALIFDCDGTLVDTMPSHLVAWREAYNLWGLPERHRDDVIRFVERLSGKSTLHIVEDINRHFGFEIEAEQFSALKESSFLDKSPRLEPILPVVQLAKDYLGKMPLAVASGGTRENVHFALESVGILSMFDAIVTASDAVAPKPSPEIFWEAARRLNTPAQYCQVFEDGDAGIAGAKAAGMIVTDVRPYLQLALG